MLTAARLYLPTYIQSSYLSPGWASQLDSEVQHDFHTLLESLYWLASVVKYPSESLTVCVGPGCWDASWCDSLIFPLNHILPPTLATSDLLSITMLLSLWESCINGIAQYVSLWDWLFLLCIIPIGIFCLHVLCVCVYICLCMCAQLCLILYNPLDCSPPGSSVHGIFQARILWRGLPFPTLGNLLAGRFLTTASPEKPLHVLMVLNHYVVFYFYSGQCDKVSSMSTVPHAAMVVHGALAAWAVWPQEDSPGAAHLCRVPWGSGTLNIMPSSFCLPLLSLCYETPTFFIA